MSRHPFAFLLAGLLGLALAAPTLADVREDCRKMAEEEEVPAEDMEDFIAECVAVVESDDPAEATEAMERLEAIKD
jgi:hypothetical protein